MSHTTPWCNECNQLGTHLGTCSRSAMNDPAHPFHSDVPARTSDALYQLGEVLIMRALKVPPGRPEQRRAWAEASSGLTTATVIGFWSSGGDPLVRMSARSIYRMTVAQLNEHWERP